MANPHQGFFTSRQPHGLLPRPSSTANKQADDEDELTYLGTVSLHRPTPQARPPLRTVQVDPRFQHPTTQAFSGYHSTPLSQPEAGTSSRVWRFQADARSPPMPYNNTAIPPSEEITGSAALPLARVKKILGLDEDIHQCSNNGAFAITVATELFIRYIAEQSLNVVKSERKPRRNIQYKDVANAVSRIDNLEFLCDVVPKTTTFREYKHQKAARIARKKELQQGQTTLNSSRSLPKRPREVIDVDDELPDQQDESVDPPTNGHVEVEVMSPEPTPRVNGGNEPTQNPETNGDSHHGEHSEHEDVDIS